jgi:hypothetical protein
MATCKNIFPVHIRFQPNTLTDIDIEKIAEYMKSSFGACCVAKETDPISKQPFLHGGGLSSKPVSEVAQQLHSVLGFTKDFEQTTVHKDWIRACDHSRTEVVRGRAPSSGALQVTTYTLAIYNTATYERYWSVCESKVYEYGKLDAKMAVDMDLTKYSRGDVKKHWIDVWYQAMCETATCIPVDEVKRVEEMIFNYNMICKVGIIEAVAEVKYKYHMSTFWQVVHNTSASLASSGKHLIPTAKEINDLRERVYEKKCELIAESRKQSVMDMYPDSMYVEGVDHPRVKEFLDKWRKREMQWWSAYHPSQVPEMKKRKIMSDVRW